MGKTGIFHSQQYKCLYRFKQPEPPAFPPSILSNYSAVWAEALLRACYETDWGSDPLHVPMSFFMVEALQLFMLLHSKPLQLNVCFSLTPACKTHIYFFWVTSLRKAREGNEGGNSLNLHWRCNCRKSQQWFHHSSTPSKLALLQSSPLRLAFALSPSAQHQHTSICVANSFGCSTAESFLTFSFVRTVRFSAGLT